MQWRWAPLVFFLLTLFTVFSPAQASTAALKVLTVLPQEVLLTLPKGEGQEFQVSYTSHPMKVIIDSNLPIPDLPERQKIDDVALRELRYSQEPGGASRLVLEFNYWLPEGVVQEDEHLFQLTVPKTFVETTRRIVDCLLYTSAHKGGSYAVKRPWYLTITLLSAVGLLLGSTTLTVAESLFPVDQPASMFADRKARRPGDLVTVIIVEQAQARQTATTSTGKDSEVSVGPGGGVLADLIPLLRLGGGDSFSARCV